MQAWEQVRLHDVLGPHLDIVFVGINPGRWSAQKGHHFAGPNNHFWRLLADAGITPRLLTPEEDTTLLDYRLGVTNMVDRPSHGSSDLTQDELRQGADRLVAKLVPLRPYMVCLLGKDLARVLLGWPRSRAIDWGRQEALLFADTILFVAPNPSSRSTIPYAERLALMQALQELRHQRQGNGGVS